MKEMLKKVKGTKMKMEQSPMRELPSFSLSEKDLPELKDWEVGKKYNLEIEVEQIGKEKNSYMTDNKNEIMGRFKIVKIKAENSEEVEKLKSKYR